MLLLKISCPSKSKRDFRSTNWDKYHYQLFYDIFHHQKALMWHAGIEQPISTTAYACVIGQYFCYYSFSVSVMLCSVFPPKNTSFPDIHLSFCLTQLNFRCASR